MSKITIEVKYGDRAKSFAKDELLQPASYIDVMKSLDECLKQAKDFRGNTSHNGDCDPQKQPWGRIDNAIFINGKRGTGKTAFILSLEEVWRNHPKSDQNVEKNLHFFPTVDPTLLNHCDDFLAVVVSQIYREISKISDIDPSDSFWSTFDAVGEALGAECKEGTNQIRGTEMLMAFRDHNDLEARLEKFFMAACKILGAKALVILIDDVDMSLGKGFHILDVIRRYLASPLVIPVISGDMSLYDVLLTQHFAKELSVEGKLGEITSAQWRPPSGTDEYKNNPHLLGNAWRLATQYLNKVLPRHQRTTLHLIPQLLTKNEIWVNFEDSKDVFLKNILAWASQAMSFNANGVEDSRVEFDVQTSRDLIQLLQALSRRDLPWGKDGKEWESCGIRLKVAKAAASYADAEGDMPRLFRAQADLQILAECSEKRPTLRLADMAFFDPIKHPQKDADFAIDWTQQGRPQVETLYALVPMPGFEPYNVSLFIGKEIEKKTKWSEISSDEKFLIRLFTHDGYYHSSGYQTKNLLFFGRAFELVVSNLFGEVDQALINAILQSPPYYSYFHFFPTKSIDTGIEVGDKIEETPTYVLDDSIIKEWTGLIDKWYKDYPWLKDNPPSAQLLYKVMNKAFTQFNLYKGSLKQHPLSTLAEQNKRFALIVLNAFASFESTNPNVALQNIAQGNLKNYTSDSSWVRNIAPLLYSNNSDKNVDNTKEKSFTHALSLHPLLHDALSGSGLGADVQIGSWPKEKKPTSTTGVPLLSNNPDVQSGTGDPSPTNDKLSHINSYSPNKQLKNALGPELCNELINAKEEEANDLANRVILNINDATFQDDTKKYLWNYINIANNGIYKPIRNVMKWAGKFEDIQKLFETAPPPDTETTEPS